MSTPSKACAGKDDRPPLDEAFFDPTPVRKGQVRASRMGRRRAAVLIVIHVIAFAHIVHWKTSGETIAPLEPSEAMYTVARGVVNAGAVLLMLSILSVLIVGRYFCGWACHLVALQDLCAWMMKKIGIRPRPLKSRLLAFVPLLAGLYMFTHPLITRLARGLGFPDWTSGLTKTDFWETFPGFWVGLLTFLVCGFIMVYLLGAKGFCTYACPYGGLFGVADRLSPGRIRVTDACKGCGHCTSTCTSNVQVADEVARYRMVVDTGCMKCMDCISVCPEEALYFGMGRPALGAKPRTKKKKHFDVTWGEEATLVVVFALSLAVFAGLPEGLAPWGSSLYGVTPLLFSLGLASTAAFVAVMTTRLLRRRDVTLPGLPLAGDGRLTPAGKITVGVFAVFLAFIAHSGLVQYHVFRGQHLFAQIDVASLGWRKERTALPRDVRKRVRDAERHFERARAVGLFDDIRMPSRLAGLAMVRGDAASAVRRLEEAVEMDPTYADTHASLARIEEFRGRIGPAIDAATAAAKHAPERLDLQAQLARLLVGAGRLNDALPVFRAMVDTGPAETAHVRRFDLALALLQLGKTAEGRAEVERVLKEQPDFFPAQAALREIEKGD